MFNEGSGKRTIIITGGNSGLGYECAKIIAKESNENYVILACRSSEKTRAALHSLRKATKNENIIALDIDLASLESIRAFRKEFLSLGYPPLYAVVCNAGVQIINGIQYTKDGFESTFGVNHLGHFLLVNILLGEIINNGRIIFVSSDTHDPKQKTGMPEPIYDKAEYLAFPETSNDILSGRERYTTSKLCNIYCTYELSERIASQTDKNITVNAFNPGMMPGTGLARDYSLILKLLWNYILPVLVIFKKNVNTVRTSGKALAWLVTGSGLEHLNGKYFNGRKQADSSALSYNKENSKDLWRTSVELAQLKQEESILQLD